MHSHLFFEADLVASTSGQIRALKNEVYQICSGYYSTLLDHIDDSMQHSPDQGSTGKLSILSLILILIYRTLHSTYVKVKLLY